MYLVHRRDELRASKAMQHRVLTNPKIEMCWNSRVSEILGTPLDGVTGIELTDTKTGEKSQREVTGGFVAIGHKPATDFLGGQLKLNEQGYIEIQHPTSATSVPGVFAAGDVCDPNYRQAVMAAAGGCRAAMDVERFLQEN